MLTSLGAAARAGSSSAAAGLSALLSSLNGVDLALGELCDDSQYEILEIWVKNSPPVPTLLSGVPSSLRPPCSVGLYVPDMMMIGFD